MDPNKVETNGTIESATLGCAPAIPAWINEEHFIDMIRDTCPGFKKILKFEPALSGGAGENYASIMCRIKVQVELEGSIDCVCRNGTTTRNLAFMIKTVPQGEQGASMVNMMGLFPKELTMYSKYLPEFEQIYADFGKKVNFVPKLLTLKKNPGAQYVLLEDLSLRGFKNMNRLEGLDQEHTESVLKLLAELHAVSAVRYETKGAYDESFIKGLFTEEYRPMLEAMFKTIESAASECFQNYKISSSSREKIKILQEESIDLMIQYGSPDPEDFNVINHGDLWANNIMFRHNDEDKLEETIFVDLQISRYGSPAIDLYYFLMSSTNLELKCVHFDQFIKYYHDHLVENLKLLEYSKKIPTLKNIHEQLLKYSFWGFSAAGGVMSAVLLDPTEKANIEVFLDGSEEGRNFHMQVYSNARYTKHMETIIPWMETRGLLDK